MSIVRSCRKSSRAGGAVLFATLVAVGSAANGAGDDTFEHATDPAKIALMKRGMDSARTKLVIPESAQFRHVFWSKGMPKNSKGRAGDPVVCGEVRGKADDGTFGDFQRFIASGEPDGVVVEMELSHFSEGWDAYCK